MTEERDEASITTPAGSVSVKGKHSALYLSAIGLFVSALVAYVLWEHKSDAKESNKLLRDAIDAMTDAQKEGVAAQREMNCLIIVPQELREKQADICRRIVR